MKPALLILLALLAGGCRPAPAKTPDVLTVVRPAAPVTPPAQAPLPDGQDAIGTQNAARVRELGRWDDSPGQVTSLSVSPEGTLLAVGTQRSGSLWLRSLKDGAVTARMALSGDVYTVAFSPDGATVAAGFWGGLTLWRSSDGTLVRQGRMAPVRQVAFSPGGTRLAVNADHAPLQILDAGTGATLWRLQVGAEHYASAFAPDEDTLVSVTDRQISIWDLTGEPGGAAGPADRFSHVTEDTGAFCLDYAPDGNSIATQRNDGAIMVFAMPSGELLHILGRGGPAIRSLAYSPGGALIAAGASDGAVRLWDAAAGALLATLAGHLADVQAVKFTPDGALLVSGSLDGTVRIWGVP